MNISSKSIRINFSLKEMYIFKSVFFTFYEEVVPREFDDFEFDYLSRDISFLCPKLEEVKLKFDREADKISYEVNNLNKAQREYSEKYGEYIRFSVDKEISFSMHEITIFYMFLDFYVYRFENWYGKLYPGTRINGYDVSPDVTELQLINIFKDIMQRILIKLGTYTMYRIQRVIKDEKK